MGLNSSLAARLSAVASAILCLLPVCAQTRIQLSQIRNLAQISPAPVAAAQGGTQVNLAQLRWPKEWFNVAQIVDQIAQANTGRFLLYTFQGATVSQNGATSYNDTEFARVHNQIQNPIFPESYDEWDPNFTADSLDWFHTIAPRLVSPNALPGAIPSMIAATSASTRTSPHSPQPSSIQHKKP